MLRYTKISFTGYSLGGLWSRFAIGELYRRGILTRSGSNSKLQLEPIIFTTFATPHLGSIFQGAKPRARFFNVVGKSLLGYSGKDLFLVPASETTPEDDWIAGNKDWKGKSLLFIMSDPKSDFFKGLQLFQHRIIYANAVRDRTVPFHTAYMSLQNPFRKSGHVIRKMRSACESEVTSDIGSGTEEDSPLVATNTDKNKVIIDIKWSKYIADPHSLEHKLGIESNTNLHTPQDPNRPAILTTLFILGPVFFPIVFIFSAIATISSMWRVKRLYREERVAKEANHSDATETSLPKPTVHKRRQSVSEGLADITGRAVDNYIIKTNPPTTSKEGVADERDEVELDETDDEDNLEDAVSLFDESVPYLNLSDDVKEIYYNLNGVEDGSKAGLTWEKRVVFLHRFNTHSEIINRMNFKQHKGRDVLEDWVQSISSKL